MSSSLLVLSDKKRDFRTRLRWLRWVSGEHIQQLHLDTGQDSPVTQIKYVSYFKLSECHLFNTGQKFTAVFYIYIKRIGTVIIIIIILTQAVAILCVEACVVDEVDTAANHIACCKRGSVRLPRARRAEGVAVVSVVTIRVFVPTWRT